ncbi:hypothetical protein SLEP1_g54802 [Rubroshorea leprosula]|uniref:Uncharacterized protein n=1 Tax=Rubroshorea leprosula TaxID=152421 RepID=A0AAV5MFN6_9ROSI|nr:hypothetical protein SLEP1_g54802 [Rubroshorea leprosula]
MDMGPCPKVHSLQLRREYQEAKAKGIDNYDRELEDAMTGSLLSVIGKLLELSSILKMRMQRPLLLYQSLKLLRHRKY